MAEIRPFRALEYDTSRVPLQRVVTQPYDKISPAMRERYLAAHSHNLVRVLRPLDATDVPAGVSPYQHARSTLETWQREGILRQSNAPAVFAYYQSFRVPGSGEQLTRKGFIGLTRLADYAEGIVFPHERTLSGPREDRLELLRHTRTHFGQVFLMYSDPEARAEALLDQAIGSEAPVTVRDEFEVEHMLWRIVSPETISGLAEAMADKKLLIADGHHRYETALRFRDDERRRSGEAGGAEWLMTTLVNMDSQGLVVLPTHRVLSNLDGFDPEEMLVRAREFFEVRDVVEEGDLLGVLKEQQGSRAAVGVVAGNRRALLVLREPLGETVLPDLPRNKAALEVVLLHRLVLEQCLGLTEEDVRRQTYIRYVRDAGSAISDVDEGRAQACFLLNPMPVEQLRDVAFSGQVLPQKSTDFFPKLLSGLAMYTVGD